MCSLFILIFLFKAERKGMLKAANWQCYGSRLQGFIISLKSGQEVYNH